MESIHGVPSPTDSLKKAEVTHPISNPLNNLGITEQYLYRPVWSHPAHSPRFMYAALDFLPAGVTLRPARYRDAWGIYALLYRHSRDFRPDRLASCSRTPDRFATESVPSLDQSTRLSNPIVGITIGLLGAWALQSPVLMGGLVTIGAGLIGLYALQWLTLIRDVSHYQVVTIGSHLVGCAKVQPVGLTAADRYISNLVVSSSFRRQGLGSLLVRQLQQSTGPTYLFCLPNRLNFYQRLGFDVVAIDRLPPMLHDKLPGLPKQIIAMVYG